MHAASKTGANIDPNGNWISIVDDFFGLQSSTDMYSMPELLKRALAWQTTRIDINDVTDRAKNYALDISPGLRPEDILTPEEVAARLKVPESWVYEKTRARCRNPIPCLRLGRYVRFDWNAVIKCLSSKSQHNAERASLPQKRKLVR